MDYTREPIIETVITPREGCKLVVRNSKGAGQEEYFVDAIEVVSFGSSSFFRSIERPKPFLVPVSDYEVLEVREARMVLKNVGLDRSIKIGGGREPARPMKEAIVEKVEQTSTMKHDEEAEDLGADLAPAEAKTDSKVDRKRERRRHYRRRRGRDEGAKEDGSTEEGASTNLENQIILPEPRDSESPLGQESTMTTASSIVSSLLPPPPTLISETIERYKKKGLFKEAFFSREEAPIVNAQEELQAEGNSQDSIEESAPIQEAVPVILIEEPQVILTEVKNPETSESLASFLEQDSNAPASDVIQDAEQVQVEDGLALASPEEAAEPLVEEASEDQQEDQAQESETQLSHPVRDQQEDEVPNNHLS